MIYSKTSGYAIRALGYLPGESRDKPIGIQELSKACRISPSYLAKIFQVLAQVGLVSSQRGPMGGFVLAKDPKFISLWDIIQITDDSRNSPLSGCVMGLNECGSLNPCMLHNEWSRMTKKIKSKLIKSTIKDVANLRGQWKLSLGRNGVLSKKVKALFHVAESAL